MGGREAVGAFLNGVAVRPIDVAHSDDLVGAGLVGSVEQVSSGAGANHSNANSVVAPRPELMPARSFRWQ